MRHRRWTQIRGKACCVLVLGLLLQTAVPCPAQVVIDEVLADPASGPAGDANGDGTRHSYADEFVELFNAGADTVSLDGWRLGDDDTALEKWFVFPAGTRLPPQGRVVVFGGGVPVGFAVPVFTGDGRIGNGLTNRGDTVVLLNVYGDTVDAVSSTEWGHDQSLVRFPPGTGDFTPHATPPGRGTRFSPGRPRAVVDSVILSPADTAVFRGATWTLQVRVYWSDGQVESPPVEWTSGDPDLVAVDSQGRVRAFSPGEGMVQAAYLGVESRPAVVHIARPPPPPPVVINEVLADPASGPAGDANRDGARHTYEDEFVELFNAGVDTVSLDGWALADGGQDPDIYFRFPSGTRLPPGAYVTVFGGGIPVGFAVPVFTGNGRLGNGLTNRGDTVILLDVYGDTVDAVSSTEWGHDQSLVRWPEGSGSFVPHDAPPGRGEPFSPNAPRPVCQELALSSPVLTFHPGDAASLQVLMRYSDGQTEIIQDGVEWFLSDAGVATIQADTLRFSQPGQASVQAFYGDWPSNVLDFTVLPLPSLPPSFLSVPDTTARGGVPYRCRIAVDDPNGNSLALSLEQAPSWLLLDPENLLLHGLPPAGIRADLPVRLHLNDGTHLVAQTFTLHLRPGPELLITEILADPPGDANGDGVVDPYADEFIELLNLGPPVDLSGWRLSEDDTRPEDQFRFPPGVVLATGEYLVLFGGGRPGSIPGLAFADDGRLGNGLTNGGDRILLIAGDEPDTVIDLTYASKSNLDRSLTYADGHYVPHDQLPGRGRFSPGRERPLYTHFHIDTLGVIQGQEPSELVLRGRSPEGEDRIPASIPYWLVMDEDVVQVSKDGQVRGLRPGRARVEAWVWPRFLARGIVQVRPPDPPPNQLPRITSRPDTTVYAGGPYRYQIQATDPEGSTLVHFLAQGPPWLRLHYESGLLSGRAPSGTAGVAEVAFEVDDGRGGVDAQRFRLRILPRPLVYITEILADPPPGPIGDASGDGSRHPYADEFVELHNAGDAPVDLSGWRVSDGDVPLDDQFRFPAGAVLPPGARAVLFGGGRARGERVFVAGSRIGDGLGNGEDQIFLIDPEGPDTLARAAYRLERDPDQSLCWLPAAPAPVLHGQWPGRDPFSPGRPRPVLQQVRLVPERLRLVLEETVRLKLVGLYSDGRQQELSGQPTWLSSHPGIVSVDGAGAVTGGDTGQSVVSARLDTYMTNICQVQVHLPLKDRVDFFPAWELASVPPHRRLVFAVRPRGEERPTCRWFLNGRRQRTTDLQLSHTCPQFTADTVQVQVNSHRESLSRRWILQANVPPRVEPLSDTLAIAGQPYAARLRGEDPDGDPLFYVLEQAPPGMRLHPSTGALQWAPAAADTGRFAIGAQILDGHHRVAFSGHLRVVPSARKPVVSSVNPRVATWPNPFNAIVNIGFSLPGERPVPTSVRLYDLAGQSIRILLDETLPPGQHLVQWDGRDAVDRPVASGIYIYKIQRGARQISGKLLLLR